MLDTKGRVSAPAIFFLAIAIAAIAAAGWLYTQYSYVRDRAYSLQAELEQTQVSRESADVFIEKVSRHIILAEDATPTVGTINNAAELAATQSFFAKAQDGDVLLVYPTQAIIYRPSADIIVHVGAVEVAQEDKTPPEQDSEAEDGVQLSDTILIEVRNGSALPGKATEIIQQLRASTKSIIADPTNAARSDYERTLIVNTTDQSVQQLLAIVGGTEARALPEGEAPSDADIIIILGNDALL